MSGDIQQLVWPYIVSGLNVAATKYIGFSLSRPSSLSRQSGSLVLESTTIFSFMSVYSWGAAFSPYFVFLF
jgi:hypothetical protein